MPEPYNIATLLYGFNQRDETLLMRRTREPNLGLWSPCGGKLRTALGESPYACACREAGEEIGLRLEPADLHLTGIVSECGFGDREHWLMFLFEITPRLERLPPPHPEGAFAFFKPEQIPALDLPRTDAEQIWPLFWRHRGGFFAARVRRGKDGADEWQVEESAAGNRSLIIQSL